MIAKAVFRDGYLSRQFQRIRAALILDFRIESGEKCFREFGEIHVGALEGAAPKNKISDQGENNQNKCQYSRIPERETDADGIKHGSSGREKPPWHAAVAKHFRLPRPRRLNRSGDQRSNRRLGGYGARVCWNRRQFSGARD